MTVKQLFKVVDTTKGKQADTTAKYFSNKVEAKEYRNSQNLTSNVSPYRIGRGPDHWRGSSFPVMSNNIEKQAKEAGEKVKKKRESFNKRTVKSQGKKGGKK